MLRWSGNKRQNHSVNTGIHGNKTITVEVGGGSSYIMAKRCEKNPLKNCVHYVSHWLFNDMKTGCSLLMKIERKKQTKIHVQKDMHAYRNEKQTQKSRASGKQIMSPLRFSLQFLTLFCYVHKTQTKSSLVPCQDKMFTAVLVTMKMHYLKKRNIHNRWGNGMQTADIRIWRKKCSQASVFLVWVFARLFFPNWCLKFMTEKFVSQLWK